MNTEQQIKHLQDFTEQQMKIMCKKSKDYANDEDRLINFKLVGILCGIPAEKVALVCIAIKVVRLCMLLNENKTPENESIHDSNIDLAVYTALFDMVLKEK